MAGVTPIEPSAPWLRLSVDEGDWAGVEREKLVRWYGEMLLVRRFEEKLLDLEKAGLIHGPAHVSIGQEATAVGAVSLLGRDDRINGTHRAHHQVLTKLVNAEAPDDFDPLAQGFTPPMAAAVQRLMAEIMGLKAGFCGGRGGSMHMRHAPSGVVGTSAIIGGNLPHAAGYALADKLLGRANISVAFFGDGTIMAGAAYEAMNIAALHRLPVIFFLENNFYAVSTHVNEQTRETRLASRGPMLGFPGFECDGMDVVAVHAAMKRAREHIERDGGPVLIEALCYRFMHQSGGRAGSEFGYRTREEEAEWRRRDPLALAETRLQALNILDRAGMARIDGLVTGVVAQAADALTEAVPGGNARRVPETSWPDPKGVDAGILGDLSELKGRRFLELADVPEDKRETVRFITAASEAIARRMEDDPRIVVMGEDVHRLRGGVSGALRNALERWPERVLAMPIAENGFTGVALGAALNGLRPIVEIMFGDFCLVAADQLFNGVAKVRHMFGDGFPVPVTVRVRVSPHTGYGSQHSGDPSGLFALFPGWRIVSPTTPFDYVGLLNSALTCNDPVVIVEHVELFQTEGPVPEGDRDFLVPFGKARLVRPGKACTVLATSVMVKTAETVAAEEGIDAEIIDLRSLDDAGRDWPLIEASVRKTNRVAVVEQVQAGLALSPRVTRDIQDRLFDWLDHEVLHVSGSRAAPVVSAPLNRAALGNAEKVRGVLHALTAVR